MKTLKLLIILLVITIICSSNYTSVVNTSATIVQGEEPIIADHTVIFEIWQNTINDSVIEQAKANLHIAYEHTSHGSQLITGMNGLIGFQEDYNNVTEGLYNFNNGGTDGALDLHDYAMSSYAPSASDLGYADWALATSNYLDDPQHNDTNVIMWSWCGQVGSYDEQGMIDHYLAPMTALETSYPDVMFVYMTGHVDGQGLEGSVHLRNEQIRDYCVDNNKILYDFADIESYDPDGNWYGDKFVTDNCDWHNDTHSGNWATEWQAAHPDDWFSCSPAHTQPLNGNLKGYALWWLLIKLSGWNGTENGTTFSSSDGSVSESTNFSTISIIAGLTFAIIIVKYSRKE